MKRKGKGRKKQLTKLFNDDITILPSARSKLVIQIHHIWFVFKTKSYKQQTTVHAPVTWDTYVVVYFFI